ncbi:MULTISPECIES: FadR/GntR family transcriptional regulator [Ochrobactrum]|uniref:GntR family transcriptional regulator n=1 Tax=Ochrobactrum chromiisoli TaxID=2993941 RepID=A0ABT3QT72_9HYPH|nr:FCD domain-containing protein [Ochrobactrum chromiisoli]MCX2698815.1 GntR family transcriptional regulator [Ochrobactrum chromiisoli]
MAQNSRTKLHAASPGKAKRRPEVIAERIRHVIQTEGLQPGDRLPQEKDLIDQFKAAKGTVREAMKALETQGLLFTRTGPGGGVFVAEPSAEHAMEMLGHYFFFDQPGLEEIYAIRKLLEPEIAASLAGKLDSSDLERLESTMRFYDRAPKNLDDQFQQRVAELDFHSELAQRCPNRLLGFICRLTHKLLRDMPLARAIYADPTPSSREEGLLFQHRLLASLIENRPEDARKIALEHMISAEEYMISKAKLLSKSQNP